MPVIEAKSNDDFSTNLEDQSSVDKLLIIKFYATWCGPCRQIGLAIKRLVQDYGDDVIWLNVDIDECEETAEQYEVSCMPMFVFMRQGKRLDEVLGANEDKLVDAINKFK